METLYDTLNPVLDLAHYIISVSRLTVQFILGLRSYYYVTLNTPRRVVQLATIQCHVCYTKKKKNLPHKLSSVAVIIIIELVKNNLHYTQHVITLNIFARQDFSVKKSLIMFLSNNVFYYSMQFRTSMRANILQIFISALYAKSLSKLYLEERKKRLIESSDVQTKVF